MKTITCLFSILFAALLCSCSSISAGRYVVSLSHEGLEEMTNDTWRTYGAAPIRAGAPLRDTIEPTIGRMRPPVMNVILMMDYAVSFIQRLLENAVYS